MFNLNQLNQDIATLPQAAQQLIIDFVAFLKHRYPPILQNPILPIDLDKEPFIGMWSDRPEMQDSAAWVRQIRQQHWCK